MDVKQILEARLKEHKDKTAVIFRDQKISFAQIYDVSLKLAASLEKLGVRKSDKVAIYLPACPEYIYSYLAIWLLGSVSVPLDFMLTQDELVSCIAHSEAKILIAKAKHAVDFAGLSKGASNLKQIITLGESSSEALDLHRLIQEEKPLKVFPQISPKDHAIIFYTSGTTGKPKGVLINYQQLGAPAKSMSLFVNGDLTSKDNVLCALPFSHLGGLIYIQNLIFFGYTLILMERFMPVEFLKNIQQYKVACFWIVPSMYYALLQLKEFETFDLSSLRWIVTFGASNSPDALRRFHQFCPGAHLLNGWGMTETNAPTTVLPMGSDNIESVGRSAPWIKVRIFDEQDKEVSPGQVGEVVVQGDVVTDGYYKDEALTRETIRNNWFYTGDLGKIDAQGFLYIVGRKKEMLKVAGEIVFEPEIEAVLQKHESIAEVAVVGMPDKLRGEVPKAYIVLRQNAVISEDDLRYFCKQHLAHFKVPHSFEILASLPKNRSGKINKEELRNKNQ
ncbi:MAG: AMP-binding protein [Candidatus Omnitrophica bacterium]|nr:AMP-binding protein [Candidatus Omnitrophota bacterium]